jgi:hypothetical protein
MNQQIEELARKCGAWNQVYGDRNFMIDEHFDIAKFAELIVRECADICMEMAAKCAGLPGDGALAKDCADWIKKDFGVEE